MQESLSSGMSIKLNIFDLDYPQKPPICIIPEGIHSVLSFFAFSDDSKSIALICDANQAFCYELSGNLLYKKVFHGIYRNNEVYFSTAGALAFIFSYEFDPCADLDFDDEEYDGGADEDCDDIAANLGVPCSIWKWNMETGELAVLYCFLGAAHMHPTATYLTGKGAFLIHDGDNNQIKYLNCNTLMEKAVFVPITRENQDPPAAFHHYAEMPAMCMIMYSDCCYLVNIESEINGNNGVLKCFTIKGIEKKLKEKGVDTQLHFSTNVAPSSTQFLAFDNNAKTYEWDSENDTIRAKYNEAYYDTAYDFAPSVSCGGAKLLFFLGNVEGSQNVEHTVSFDDITLIPLPDDIVTNGNFVNDLTSWSTWTENGSTYSVDAGEQCFVANIPTTLPNAWSAQLYQVIDVPASGSYRVTFKAKASMNREIRLALEKDGQSPLMDETMSVSADWTNYSYDFTVSSAASGVKLVFMLGNVGTTENMAHTISIDDISLYKVS